jgi:hypothetical protein
VWGGEVLYLWFVRMWAIESRGRMSSEGDEGLNVREALGTIVESDRKHWRTYLDQTLCLRRICTPHDSR